MSRRTFHFRSAAVVKIPTLPTACIHALWVLGCRRQNRVGTTRTHARTGGRETVHENDFFVALGTN